MSTGGSGADSGRLFRYGSSTAGPNVDLTDDQAQGAHGGYQPESGGKTSSVMNTLKEALRPNDARQPVENAAASDTTHDGRHGGIIETMKPGNQDYDAREKSGASGGGGGPVTDTIKEALGRNGSPSGTSQDRTNTETTEKNYSHGELPSTGSPKGTFSKGSEIHDRATPRVSAFDSQGTVGHQFTSEGAIGGAGEKVGGPFSKEGVVGKQFTDTGTIGGTIHDNLGHGNVTRKGN